MRISELHTRLATLTQHFSLIRSMTHVGNISNHFDAMHHLLSGQAGARPTLRISVPSCPRSAQRTQRRQLRVADQLRRRSRLLCSRISATGGHLGAEHSPLFVGSATNHPAMPGFRGSGRIASGGSARANAGTSPVAGRPESCRERHDGSRDPERLAGLAPPCV